MVHWHELDNLARVVVKVYLNVDAKIPALVKVNVGLPKKGRSRIVPCFVLKQQRVIELPDEEAYVTIGPLHPQPPQPSRWLGLIPLPNATLMGSNSGSAMNLDGAGPSCWQEQLAPLDDDVAMQAERQNVQATGEVYVGPDATNTVDRSITAAGKFPVLEAAHFVSPALKSIIVSSTYGPSILEDPWYQLYHLS